jgi:hypothetical protein
MSITFGLFLGFTAEQLASSRMLGAVLFSESS